VVYGFGLHAACSCMARDICGSWDGILGDGCRFDTKVGLRMMITKVDASGLCD
jgi:hypothetical protein